MSTARSFKAFAHAAEEQSAETQHNNDRTHPLFGEVPHLVIDNDSMEESPIHSEVHSVGGVLATNVAPSLYTRPNLTVTIYEPNHDEYEIDDENSEENIILMESHTNTVRYWLIRHIKNDMVDLKNNVITWIKRRPAVIKDWYNKRKVRKKIARKEKIYQAFTTQQNPADAQTGDGVMWENTFPGYVIGTWYFIRSIVTTSIWPGVVPPTVDSPRDAFWLMKNIGNWLSDHCPKWLKTVFNWIGNVLSNPKIAAVLQYVPFVGLFISAACTVKNYVANRNKSIYSTAKMIFEVSAAVLIGVGLGIIKWGAAALAIKVAPYLIAAAAGLVTIVGVCKMARHFYKAFKDPANRWMHIYNGSKELLCTFINAIGLALTVIGIQAGHKLMQFDLKAAGGLFQKTVAITYAALTAAVVYVGMRIAPSVVRGCKAIGKRIWNGMKWVGRKIKNLCTNRKSDDAILVSESAPVAPSVEKQEAAKILKAHQQVDYEKKLKALSEKVDVEVKRLQKKVMVTDKDLNLNRSARDTKKFELLTQLKHQIESKNLQTSDVKAVEQRFVGTRVYQSFFKVKGKTQELMDEAFEIARSNPSAAPAA